MKTSHAIICLFLMQSAMLRADDDTPVPPELQKQIETLVTALKTGDDTSLISCWHGAEALGKIKARQAAAEASTSPKPVDAAKEQDKEIKRQTRNLEVTLARAAQMRTQVGRLFGGLNQLTLTSVEVSKDDDASPDLPRFDDVEIRLKAADGTQLKIEVDAALCLDGAWKFQGRLEDDLTIELPDVD